MAVIQQHGHEYHTCRPSHQPHHHYHHYYYDSHQQQQPHYPTFHQSTDGRKHDREWKCIIDGRGGTITPSFTSFSSRVGTSRATSSFVDETLGIRGGDDGTKWVVSIEFFFAFLRVVPDSEGHAWDNTRRTTVFLFFCIFSTSGSRDGWRC